MSVAPQSINLELLEHLGEIQRQELVLDVLSKSPIKLIIKRCIIPPCVGHVFGELNHVLVDMLMVVHLECAQGLFGGLGQVGLSEISVQLVNKLTPIVTNGWFGGCDQDQLPPHHGDVREVRRHVRHSLAVSRKLTRPTVEGHNTADYKGAQLRWLPTSELIGLSHFRVFLAVALWTSVVLLVEWPRTWRGADRVQLRRGWIVVGHWAPTARGVTKVLWWCHLWGDLGCKWSGWHWKWCWGCWLGWWHRGRWPRLRCWPDWGVRLMLVRCSRKEVMRGRWGVARGRCHRPDCAQVILSHLCEPACRGY